MSLDASIEAAGEGHAMISDATMLAALQTASDLAHGRAKLSAAQRELFDAHLEAIRQRIIAAAAKRGDRDGRGVR